MVRINPANFADRSAAQPGSLRILIISHNLNQVVHGRLRSRANLPSRKIAVLRRSPLSSFSRTMGRNLLDHARQVGRAARAICLHKVVQTGPPD